MEFMPCLARPAADGEIQKITLGHPLLDDYLVFVAARARTNTWLAVAYDLKVFFEVVGREPAVVTAADVFAFLSAQRAPRRPGRRALPPAGPQRSRAERPDQQHARDCRSAACRPPDRFILLRRRSSPGLIMGVGLRVPSGGLLARWKRFLAR